MHILSLLSTLADIESEMSDLYAWLAEVFDADGEAAGLFFRLSLQERSHYNLVRFAKRLVHSSPAEFVGVTTDGQDLVRLRECIAGFRAAPPPTLEEALGFAIDIEHHAGENIHRQVIVESNPKLTGIIASLAASDADHLRKLQEFARDRLGGAGAP